MMPTNEQGAPGMDAINRALKSFYGREPARHLSESEIAQMGPAALDGISVYRSDAERPHWHFITFGFSELFEKESEIEEFSGLGFELTFRLAIEDNAKSAPTWPSELLNDLAGAILQSGSQVKVGSTFRLSAPLHLDSDTRIHALLVARDTELGIIESKNGTVEFLQLVGITLDELDVISRWRSDKFIDTARATLGKLLITDLHRQSIADDPCVALKIEENIGDTQQSSTITCNFAEWIFLNKVSVTLTTDIVTDLQKLLIDCLSAGNDLTIKGRESTIVFRSSKDSTFSIEDDVLVIAIPVSDAKAFSCQLKNTPASYSLSDLPVVVEIIDPDSINEMESEIGIPITKANPKKSKSKK